MPDSRIGRMHHPILESLEHKLSLLTVAAGRCRIEGPLLAFPQFFPKASY